MGHGQSRMTPSSLERQCTSEPPVVRSTVGRLSKPAGWIGPMPAEGCGWGGAAVVLGAGESPAHGEGRQRVRQGGPVMAEAAVGNPGATSWPDPQSASEVVRRMQAKLHRWAGADRSRRFGDLFNLVYDPAFFGVRVAAR